MNEEYVTIDPMEEAKWIRQHLIDTQGVIIDLVTIMKITDAQVAYLDHIGLLEEEPDNG